MLSNQATLDTEEELHFHWFRQHDYDNNQSLDGLGNRGRGQLGIGEGRVMTILRLSELVHAISHFSEHGIQDEDALIRVSSHISLLRRLVLANR